MISYNIQQTRIKSEAILKLKTIAVTKFHFSALIRQPQQPDSCRNLEVLDSTRYEFLDPIQMISDIAFKIILAVSSSADKREDNPIKNQYRKNPGLVHNFMDSRSFYAWTRTMGTPWATPSVDPIFYSWRKIAKNGWSSSILKFL